jgi:hypothetical protein
MKTVSRFFTFALVLPGLFCFACQLEAPSPEPEDVVWTAVADGGPRAASGAINFTFAKAVADLGAADIALSDGSGSVVPGALSGSGTAWTLGIDAQKAGTVKVRIARGGIEGAEHTVTVFKPVAWTAKAAGADKVTTSTAIAITFGEAVTGLSAEEITVANAAGKAVKGALSGSGTAWRLGIDAQKAGTVKVRIARDGIEEAEQTVTVFKAGETAFVFTPATNDGVANDAETLGLIGTAAVSSDTGVAAVEIANGKIAITSVAAGTATITVSAAGYTGASIPVTVSADGSVVIGTITKGTADGGGGFTPSVNDSVANDAATLGFTGTAAVSSDTGVATVTISANNKIAITPVAAGTATITVSAAGYTGASIAVTVSADGSVVIGAITKGTAEGGGGFTPSVNDSVANDAATLGFAGTAAVSSDTGVATVTISANNKIAITSVAAGTATITVSAGGYTDASIAVTVAADGSVAIGTPTKGSPHLTKAIDLYLSEGLAREEWTGQDTATETWVLSVEELSTVYVAAYKEAAQTVTVSGEDQALVAPAAAVDGLDAGDEFAVFAVKTGDLVFDGGERSFTLNVSEAGGALPRTVNVTLKVNTNPTGAAVFKTITHTREIAAPAGMEVMEWIEVVERVGGSFDGLASAFTWVENNAEDNTEYTIRVEHDEANVPYLYMDANGKENVTLRFRGTNGSPKTLTPIHLAGSGSQQPDTVNIKGFATTSGGFINIGGDYTSPAKKFILGSNITIQGHERNSAQYNNYIYIFYLYPNATLVLEPDSKITGFKNSGGHIVLIDASANVRIEGGAITDCVASYADKNNTNGYRGLIKFGSKTLADGSFCVAGGNVFTLNNNDSDYLVGFGNKDSRTVDLAAGASLP